MSIEVPRAALASLLRDPVSCCPACGASVIVAKNTEDVVYMVEPIPDALGRAVVIAPGAVRSIPLTRNGGDTNPIPNGTTRRNYHHCPNAGMMASVCVRPRFIDTDV